MLHEIFKGVAPLAAMVAGAFLAGCDSHVSIGGAEGVSLAELDTTGPPPEKLVLAGPDNVVVTEGSSLNIDVSGDREAVAALRFTLDDGTLGVMRHNEARGQIGKATVHITMPGLNAVVLAGSGTIEAENMLGNAEVTIAGSGTAKVDRIAAEKLDLTIAGSGNFEAAGTVKMIDLTIAGSGSGRMDELQAGGANISIVGSGSAEFSSSGNVDANIMGSGSVTVHGNATCTVHSMGSGKLRCRGGEAGRESGRPAPPEAPEPPQPLEAPSPPQG